VLASLGTDLTVIVQTVRIRQEQEVLHPFRFAIKCDFRGKPSSSSNKLSDHKLLHRLLPNHTHLLSTRFPF